MIPRSTPTLKKTRGAETYFEAAIFKKRSLKVAPIPELKFYSLQVNRMYEISAVNRNICVYLLCIIVEAERNRPDVGVYENYGILDAF